MMPKHNETPFKTLGLRLKTLRESSHESIDEVAGAVEIGTEALDKIEQGVERPSEDILMLLINHFDMREDEATKLWILAGYDQPETERTSGAADDTNRPVIMLMALDSRVLYTDNTQIHTNKSGIVLDFLQPSGPRNQDTPVARIGMSYEQAKKLLHSLHAAIVDGQAPPRGLPQPQPKPSDTKK